MARQVPRPGFEKPDGFVFDFQHDRIELDTKTALGQHSGGGFGNTVQLDDGTLVTSYSYRQADAQTCVIASVDARRNYSRRGIGG